MKPTLFAALICACMLSGPGMAGAAETVAIASGDIVGSVEDGIARFLGLPYAAPPVGELRWRPPQPVQPWSAPRDATQYGHACPQPLGKYPPWVDAAIMRAGIDEDCLTLNIWTPAGAAEQSLPVMFYIHGGNFQYGSNVMPLYDGTELAKAGVVVVFVNYRLGYLGRFAHPALSRLQAGEPLANYGIFDQLAALEWVQQNIAAFGGDPGNVTIFGHSAGGVSVNALMTTPQSRGLFHKAIAQGSGILLDRNQHVSQRLPRGPVGASSEDLGVLLAEYFAIPAGTDEAIVAALRSLTWQQLVEYQNAKQKPFNPVVDGIVVADHIAQVFERGEQHDVPYMGGANSWEWNQIDGIPLIGKWFLGGALIAGLSDEDLAMFDDQWTRIGLSQRWFAEGLFLSSTRYLGKQMANVAAPAWLFRVDYVQTAIRGKVPGAGHGVEMPYLFGQIAEHPEYQRPGLAAEHAPSAADLAWGDTVRGYWLNFAKTGNPNGPGLPVWPEYRPETDVTLVMGEQFEPVSGLDKATLDALEKRALLRRAAFDESTP
ncbi:MAG: carboxylesterase family protein [Gammaproteobacteria bacterium]|jgi:para-nitrobenzyl esterase|nr:carboxylesterase family protein [Gammaproteobacteria bacterium]